MTVTDTEHVDVLRQTDEHAPLTDAALDAIRARNERLREVPFEGRHDGREHGDNCIPCELVRGVGDVTGLLEEVERLRAQLAEHKPGPTLHAVRFPNGNITFGDAEWCQAEASHGHCEHVEGNVCHYRDPWRVVGGVDD